MKTATWIMMQEENRLLAAQTKKFIESLDPAQAMDYKESLIDYHSVIEILNIFKELNT